MPTPTVGRMLHFYPSGRRQVDKGVQPLAAQIAYVHSDTCVNIGYLDSDGLHQDARSVRLVQEGEELPSYGFCCWPPREPAPIAQAWRDAQPQADPPGLR